MLKYPQFTKINDFSLLVQNILGSIALKKGLLISQDNHVWQSIMEDKFCNQKNIWKHYEKCVGFVTETS